MFEITNSGSGRIELHGRFDASQAETVRDVLNCLSESAVVDFGDLQYISSAGLGVLLATQKRLRETGERLKLINLNGHIREIFRIAGFDRIFEIE